MYLVGGDACCVVVGVDVFVVMMGWGSGVLGFLPHVFGGL